VVGGPVSLCLQTRIYINTASAVCPQPTMLPDKVDFTVSSITTASNSETEKLTVSHFQPRPHRGRLLTWRPSIFLWDTPISSFGAGLRCHSSLAWGAIHTVHCPTDSQKLELNTKLEIFGFNVFHAPSDPCWPDRGHSSLRVVSLRCISNKSIVFDVF